MGVDMTEQAGKTKKFAGMEVPPELTQTNFGVLFFNTLLIGMLMIVPTLIQPAFLTDVIKVSPDFFGSINSLLQNMSQIATLALVGLIGLLSDKVGRRLLAILGFIVIALTFYFFSISPTIAAAFSLSPAFAAKLCAWLSFAPARAQEFNAFAPALLTAYIIRLAIGVGLVLCYPQFIAMVADYTYEKDRGKGMGMNGLMMGVAGILVYAAIAPIQKKTGVVPVLHMVCAIALVGAVFSWLFLKDRMPEKSIEKQGIGEILRTVKKSSALKAAYMVSLVTRVDTVIVGTFMVSWAVNVADTYQLTSTAATQKAALPMIVMSITAFISFPFIGILLDKWGRIPTLLLSLSCASAGMLMIALSPSPFGPAIYVAVILGAFGMAGSVAGSNTLATDASPKGMVGAILGGVNTMQPLGILFFMALGGYLFDRLGPGWAFALKGMASLILVLWLFVIKKQLQDFSKEEKTQ